MILQLLTSFACFDSTASVPTAPPFGDVVAIETALPPSFDGPIEGALSKESQRGATSGVALPKEFLNFSMPVLSGRSIVVPADGNLQRALNSAQRGDEIVLTAGATYTGNFVLPAKAGTSADGWIVVRSDKSGELPAVGTRVSPSEASLMAKIVTPSVSAAIKTSGPSSGWWLVGLEVTVAPALTAQQYGIITLGEGQTTMAAVPQDLVLDRMYIHGQTTTNLSRCVALNSGRTQVSDSYITECHGKDFDAQAIAGWNGPGPFKIVNNMLMGSGENVIFGGADPSVPGLVPSDIEIRRNYFYTPLAWKGVWLKKNLLELKNATRVLVEGNVLDGSWTHGQTGWAIVLMSTNQSGGCSWCIASDITIRRNLIKNAGAGINVAGGYATDNMTTRRVLIAENVLENIGVSPYDGDERGFQLLARTQSVTLERNVLGAGNLSAALITEGGGPCVLKDNVWNAGRYGVFASGGGIGSAALSVGCGSSYVWSNQTMIGSSGGNSYPAATRWIRAESGSAQALQIRAAVQKATTGVIAP